MITSERTSDFHEGQPTPSNARYECVSAMCQHPWTRGHNLEQIGDHQRHGPTERHVLSLSLFLSTEPPLSETTTARKPVTSLLPSCCLGGRAHGLPHCAGLLACGDGRALLSSKTTRRRSYPRRTLVPLARRHGEALGFKERPAAVLMVMTTMLMMMRYCAKTDFRSESVHRIIILECSFHVNGHEDPRRQGQRPGARDCRHS